MQTFTLTEAANNLGQLHKELGQEKSDKAVWTCVALIGCCSIPLCGLTQIRINCLTLLRRKGVKTGHFLAHFVNQIALT